MTEIGTSGQPYRKNLDVPRFQREHSPKSQNKISFKGALIRAAALLGFVGTGVAIEQNLPEKAAEKIEDAVTAGAESVQKAGETVVSFYNENEEIRRFNEETAGKLNGTIPLGEGEKIFERVKVVPAGATYEELLKMQQEGTPVNVRDHPGTSTPTGQFTRIIGTLPQGAIIEHVVIVKGTKPHPGVSNDPAEWAAFVYRKPGLDPNEPGEIGYIFGIFVKPQPQEAAILNHPSQ
ncbi:MAG: hypothetical protein A2958_02630 [Candidatus Levybacteria bacterium RIFCSPLOWO2_01_FULL_38_13]|nr:MAG: hypothetical protein A2629_03050 [Candidatus Levybacteria bacterium RIFCSPHIGHO2_01_FULL_41_15]OGH35233.1 MAG: hypothetical protein A2958_02630 [Candidatus Levybacteria bacterium RIFCSPLOWO2_01_FULL_38_13]